MKKIAYILLAVLMTTACGTSKKTTEATEQKWTEEVVDSIYYTVEVVDTIHKTVTVEDLTTESHKENREQWNDKTLEVEKPDGTKIKYTNRTGERKEIEDNLQRQLKECRDSLAISGQIIENYRHSVVQISEEAKKKVDEQKKISELSSLIGNIFWWFIGIMTGVLAVCVFMKIYKDKYITLRYENKD